MGPAAAVDALGAAHGGQRQNRAVDLIGVVVVIDARAHEYLGAALGFDGIGGELAGHADHGRCRHAGELARPRRGAGHGGVVVVLGPLTRQARPVDAVVGQEQVVDGRHQTAVGQAGSGHAAMQDAAAHRAGGRGGAGQVEAGQEHLDALDGRGRGAQLGDAHDRGDALHEQVPLALALGGEAVGQGAAGIGRAAIAVPHQGPEVVLRLPVGRARHAVRGQEAAGNVPAAIGRGVELQQEGGVGVAPYSMKYGSWRATWNSLRMT